VGCGSIHPESALGRLRQEDHSFKANLGYILRPCFKRPKKKKLKEEWRCGGSQDNWEELRISFYRVDPGIEPRLQSLAATAFAYRDDPSLYFQS